MKVTMDTTVYNMTIREILDDVGHRDGDYIPCLTLNGMKRHGSQIAFGLEMTSRTDMHLSIILYGQTWNTDHVQLTGSTRERD